jgi:hypothetical protein
MQMVGLGIDQPPSGFRDAASQLAGSLQPFLDDVLSVGESFLVGRPISHATGQLRHFGQVGFVFITLVDDDLIPNHADLPGGTLQ